MDAKTLHGNLYRRLIAGTTIEYGDDPGV